MADRGPRLLGLGGPHRFQLAESGRALVADGPLRVGRHLAVEHPLHVVPLAAQRVREDAREGAVADGEGLGVLLGRERARRVQDPSAGDHEIVIHPERAERGDRRGCHAGP